MIGIRNIFVQPADEIITGTNAVFLPQLNPDLIFSPGQGFKLSYKVAFSINGNGGVVFTAKTGDNNLVFNSVYFQISDFANQTMFTYWDYVGSTWWDPTLPQGYYFLEVQMCGRYDSLGSGNTGLEVAESSTSADGVTVYGGSFSELVLF